MRYVGSCAVVDCVRDAEIVEFGQLLFVARGDDRISFERERELRRE
jgi:hypothetical protein